jgi:hypothetical protein
MKRRRRSQAQALTPVPPLVAFVPFPSCAQQPGRRVGRSARSPPPFRPGSPSTPPPRSRRRPHAHGRTSRHGPPGALPAGKRHIPDRLLPPTAPPAPPGISVRRLSAEAAAVSAARRTTLQTRAHAVSCSLDPRATQSTPGRGEGNADALFFFLAGPSTGTSVCFCGCCAADGAADGAGCGVSEFLRDPTSGAGRSGPATGPGARKKNFAAMAARVPPCSRCHGDESDGDESGPPQPRAAAGCGGRRAGTRFHPRRPAR